MGNLQQVTPDGERDWEPHAPEPEARNYGWAYGETALYIAPSAEAKRPALYLQHGADQLLLGYFVDEFTASECASWLDAVIAGTGQANANLLKQIVEAQHHFIAEGSDVTCECRAVKQFGQPCPRCGRG